MPISDSVDSAPWFRLTPPAVSPSNAAPRDGIPHLDPVVVAPAEPCCREVRDVDPDLVRAGPVGLSAGIGQRPRFEWLLIEAAGFSGPPTAHGREAQVSRRARLVGHEPIEQLEARLDPDLVVAEGRDGEYRLDDLCVAIREARLGPHPATRSSGDRQVPGVDLHQAVPSADAGVVAEQDHSGERGMGSRPGMRDSSPARAASSRADRCAIVAPRHPVEACARPHNVRAQPSSLSGSSVGRPLGVEPEHQPSTRSHDASSCRRHAAATIDASGSSQSWLARPSARPASSTQWPNSGAGTGPRACSMIPTSSIRTRSGHSVAHGSMWCPAMFSSRDFDAATRGGAGWSSDDGIVHRRWASRSGRSRLERRLASWLEGTGR